MTRATKHCDLCGRVIESNLANGWVGSNTLKYTAGANSSVPPVCKEHTIDVCTVCSSELNAKIHEMFIPFAITTEVVRG